LEDEMIFRKIKLLYGLIRPVGAFPFLFCFLFGTLDSNVTFYLSLVSSLVLVVLIFGPIHIINHFSDTEVDRRAVQKKDLNLTKQPFLTGEITKFSGILLSIVIWLIGLIAAYMINFYFFILLAGISIGGIFYSLPPRIKGVPVFDIIFNSTGGAVSYLAGWSLSGNLFDAHIFTMAWLSFLVASTYLFTVIVDYKQDKKAGVKTTAVYFGPSKAIKLSFLLFLASVVFFVFMFLSYKLSIVYYFLIPFWVHSLYQLPKILKSNDNNFSIKLAQNKMKRSAVYCIFWLILLYLIILLRQWWDHCMT